MNVLETLQKDIDEAIVDPTTYTNSDAFDAVYTRLRAEDPVHWTEPEGFRPFWTVTKHADIVEIERQADRFLNAPRLVLVNTEEEDDIFEKTNGQSRASYFRMLVNMDNPDHRLFRMVTQNWFMPKNLQKLEESLRALARSSIDGMLARGGRCDFVNDVALHFPLRVIMTILGVPEEDEPFMLKLTQEIFGRQDPEMIRDPDALAALNAAVEDSFAYFGKLIMERRAAPTDDVASVIANSEIRGEPIEMLEAMSYCILAAFAGHDTTSSSISGGMLALIENPEEMAKLKADPSLIPNAVEEMIRVSTPVKHFFRTATEDYELRGRRIRAGDSLLMSYPSANLDEEVYRDARAFRVDRDQVSKHLAFGTGPHVCLGQHLARLEMQIFFEELLARVEDFEFDGEPEYTLAVFVCGLKRMPIRYRAVV